MRLTRRTFGYGLAALGASALAHPALSQARFPARPVRFLVPQPPGGGSDLLVRTVQGKMQELLRQPVVVENRAGAAGNIGTVEGARAAPDGYTIVFVNLSTMAINPHIYANPGFTVSDFDPLTNMALVTQVFCGKADLPAKDMREFLALAKARPGLSYATAGNGSENHLMAEMMRSMAGVNLTHVPYRGGGPAAVALVGGEVDTMMADPLSILPFVRSGRVKALGVTSARRVPSLPDVPTIAESGVPGYEAYGWRGAVVPKGTPREIVATLHAAIVGALNDPEINKKLVDQLYEPVGDSPESFGRYIASENEKMAALVKSIGLKLD
jgi:tripartite-type tricarboxylate transporter receptor subunit TctC